MSEAYHTGSAPGTTAFGRAVAFVLSREGEWSDDPADPGSRTRFGVSSRAHPDVDLEALTRERAILFYRAAYWDKAKCDQLPWPLALVLFDGAVNHGIIPATRFLQQALHIEVDGVVGPETIAAARSAPALDVVAETLARRAVLYATLHERFRLGQYRRLFALHHTAFNL